MNKRITAFDIWNVCCFILLAAIMFIPFLNVIALSLEPAQIAAETGRLHLIPQQITFKAYTAVWEYALIQKAFLNSAFITVTGTLLALVISGALAYGLAQREVMGMRLVTYIVLLTMILRVGIMPHYLLIKNLGLIDNLWSIILPKLTLAFNLILMKTYFEHLPKELNESAKIDGCSDVGIFFKIIIPLSAPIIATVALFYAVDYFNEYFSAVMYLTNRNHITLQVMLRELLIDSSGENNTGSTVELGKNLKMATTIYAIAPILLVYPFLQKHFTKGILIGAVKG
ncbi:carbohydrate ABC transporter permease [Paenibacillus piri]|uniref:Carbohydrate ABC transporter permease n=1 Tax=Paenibacillus piri TaxID=2547395 RepID=A0A4R5KW71_9BACL|nr:carbohydrate ABC transporter permease [Paenibacillus piri]TDG00260.1 carbohydrate ABC transporter permease [Paenibacillus piri]